MALNLDTALRVVAKVAGLNEFKALTDSLGKVQSTAEASAAGLQQTAAGSARTAQEAARAATASRAQATALQELQVKSRSSAAELQRMGVEARGVGSAVQQLRGQTGGVFEQLAGGVTKAANNIRQLTQAFQPSEQQLSRLRNQVLEFGAANKQTERSLKQQVDALKNLRSQAEVNGSLYQRLTNDIERVSNASKGMGSAVQSSVEGLRKVEASSRSSATAIQEQIKSLQQMQTAFAKSSDDYKEIGRDIDQLKQKLGELGTAPEPGIRGMKMMARAMEESVAKQETAIGKLRQVLNSSIEGYRAVGQQIEDLKRKAAGFNPQELMTPGGAARGVAGAVGSMVQLRRDLSRSMAGRVVLTGEGLAAAGVAGGVGAGAAAGVGGMAAGADAVATSLSHVAAQAQALPGVLKPLGGLLATPFADAAAGIANWGESLSAAQAKLTALSAPFEAIGHAISAIGPEVAAVAGAASLAIASVYQVYSNEADQAQAEAEAAFKGISDSAQKALQDLVKIYEKVPAARMEAQERLKQQNLERLANAPSGSLEARQAANAVAVAEREIAKIKGEQNQLLEQARSRQQAGSEALKSQVQIARDRLEVQRKLTAEIKASAEEDRQARQIAGAIRRNEERTRPQREAEAEAAARTQGLIEQAKQRLQQQQALTAEIKRSNAELADERAIRNSIRRYEERQQRAADRVAREQADLARRAAEAFAPSRVLALPAAGQSSFKGEVSAEGFGGGARRGRGRDYEMPLQMGVDRASRQAFMGANAYAGPGFGVNVSATEASAAGAEKLRGKLAQLFIEIDKVEAASNGSVSALQRQRTAWENLRVAVNPAAPAYERARLKVQELDAQLQKLSGTQEKVAAKRGFGREALGGALGALATGGGIQGALGSAAGTLAFSGGAAGMLAGGAITAVAGIGMLATRTGVEAETAQVRLKALTDQFGEYNQAQAAAARIAGMLRVSTTEAQDGFSKLYAALRPTGVSVKELEDAYVGFNAAARASGATAGESSAALLQLKQALGSGVLQGDELRSIREQAPLVGQAIAKEMGVTVGELKKLGSEGKITTDIVLRALAKLKYEKLDQLNAQFNTSAQAIADLKIATEDFGRAVAQAFGPGAVGLLRGFTFALKGVNAAVVDALNALTKPKAYAAEQAIRSGRLPNAVFGGIEGASELFKGTSGSGGVGLTGLIAEAKVLSKLRRQPMNDIMLELMKNRLDRLGSAQQAGGSSDAAANRDAASAERAAMAGRTAAEQRDQALKDEVKIRQDAEGKLADAAKQHAEQLADFQLQTIKRAQDLEQQLGDQRLQIEREIAQSRLSTARTQQDIGLELERQRLSALGLDTGSIDVAKATIDTFRQFEDQVAQSKQTALDRQLNLQRQLEEFKVSTADGLGKIQEAYAKTVSNILQDAGDKLAEKMRDGAKDAAATLSGGSAGGAGGGAIIASIADRDLTPNARAWLAAIRAAEGTAGPNGYRTMFGGGLFSDMSRHPDRVIRSGGYASAAAGAYQFMPDTWRSIGGGAMTPERQDRAALALALRRGVDLSIAPFTKQNVAMLAPEWASLPKMNGASYYNQPVQRFDVLSQVFKRALGVDVSAGPAQATVNAARAQLAQQAAALRNATAQAQAESRKGSFAAGVSARESQFTGFISNLDAQKKATREALEDEYRYQDLLSQRINPETAKRRIELERIVSTEKDNLATQRDIIQEQIKGGTYSAEEVAILQQQVDKINARIAVQSELLAGVEAITEATKRLQKAREDAEGRDIGKGLKDGVKGYLDSIGTLAEGIKGVTGDALKGLEDQLVTFVSTGKANFSDLARSILADMTRIIVQQTIMKPIMSGLGGLFKFADGGIMGPDGPLPLRKYASGGIANSPQLALYGEGSMPEAFVPLPDGRRIPVAMKGAPGGGNATTVNVNVDASGTNVQGNGGQGQALGRAVAAAVQQELVRQKRPGGLLAV